MIYVCTRLNSSIKKGMATSTCDAREVFRGMIIFYKSLRKSVGIHIAELVEALVNAGSLPLLVPS